jgi:hypothetical protein
MVPWHSDLGHESNDDVVTPDDVKKMKAAIRDEDLVIILFGPGIAGKNAWNYLFDGGDAPDMDRVPFFEPFIATVLRKRRVIILLPHIGVLNHVGDLDWIIQSYADVIPILLMLGTFAKTVKTDQAIPSHEAATAVLRCYQSCDVCPIFSHRLEWPKLRSFWEGMTAPLVQRHLDESMPWRNILPTVAKELGRPLVTTLRMGDPDATPILIPKQSGNKGDVYLRITVPPLHGDGRYEIESMWIPEGIRGNKDFYATLHLHPETLHLQIIKSDGTLATSTTGRPFSVSRAHWLTSRSYNGRAIEAHARRLGIWRPLSPAEHTLMNFFQRCIAEEGDDSTGWIKARCVLTLDEKEIRRGVAAGEPYLHAIRDSFKFRFWDGEIDFLHLKKHPDAKTTPWEIRQFKDARPAGVHWVVPFVEETNPLNWRFLMYGCSEESGYSPVFLGKSKSWAPTYKWKEPWPILNGARDIFLFKVR